MTFLNPTLAFAGLAAISIPILIHILMRRRRKPVLWGAMRFLLEAYRRQRQRLRLEQLLLLAARCLVVALVALALGRPLLGAAGLAAGRGATTLYLMIDNSLTSSVEDGDGRTALERSRALAADLLRGLDPSLGDRAGLIAVGGPADPMVVPASSDIGAVKGLMEALRPTESAGDLAGAASALRDQLSRQEAGGRTVVAVLSGFLAGSGLPETSLPAVADRAAGGAVTLLASRPDDAGATNIAITGVQPARAVVLAGDAGETTNQVRVSLRRFGPGVGEAAITKVRVRVAREGESPSAITAPAEQIVRWAPGQIEAVALVATGATGTAGQGIIIAEIDRDAVSGDNAWRRPVQVRESLRIGLIAPRQASGRQGLDPGSSADWLRLALAPSTLDREAWRGKGGEVELVGIDPGGVDAARLAELDVVFVASPDLLSADAWRRLRLLVDNGGVVAVVPPSGGGVHLWTDEMARSLGLNWTIGREARVLGSPDEAASGLGVSAARDPGGDLLEMVASELPELVKPVHVWKALPVTIHGGASERVLTLADGTPWIIAAAPGEGQGSEGGAAEGAAEGGLGAQGPVGGRGLIVFFGSALAIEWTDLAGKPLFVPLVQELVRQGVGRARPAWSELAGSRVAAPARAVELRPDPLGDVGPGTGADERGGSIAIDQSGRAATPLRRAGVWRAMDERGVLRGLVAVNADFGASATEPQRPETVAGWLAALSGGSEPVAWLDASGAPGGASASSVLAGRTGGTQSSLPFLFAALALGVAELCMARWFSHASVGPGPAEAAA